MSRAVPWRGSRPIRIQNISLGEGDTVIFSSRMIPGNERAVISVQDGLVRRGVRVITDDDHPVHVSGHPAREELRTLYRLVRPKFSVPTHGEWRHLSAHADLARGCGATPIMLEDGDLLSLAPGQPEVVDSPRRLVAWCWTVTGWCRSMATCCRRGGGCCSTASCWAASRSTRKASCWGWRA